MNDVRDIVARALALEGGVVEHIEPNSLNLLAPPAMREALHVPELSCVGFGPAVPVGAVRVSLESDWIDRLRDFMGDRGSFLRATIATGAQDTGPSHAERIAQKGVNLANATYRIGRIKRTHARYLMLVFHLSSVSDEKREDILSVCLNESNGACADAMIEPLMDAIGCSKTTERAPAGVDPENPWTEDETGNWCKRFLPARIRTRLKPFLAGMERRMERDIERLHGYYSDLCRDATTKTGRHRERVGEEDAPNDLVEMRIKAATDEYHAKIADIRRKYGMAVETRLVQALEAVVPVSRFEIILMRRKGRRSYHLDWNALSRQLDILPCEGCGAVAASHVLCDERLHILCPDCMRACASCGRDYCQACYGGKCPRCGKRSEI